MATKKDKVDFIYNVAKYNGLKYTKTNLNRMPEEALDEFINQSSEVKEKFDLYLAHIASEKKTESTNKSPQNKKIEVLAVSDEKIDLLNKIVNEIANNPTSFVAITNMQEFLGSLKYGEIPDDVLNSNIDILTDVSPGWAMKLLEFSVAQTVALQDN
ncbi:MAG: hypothetical protein IJO70_00745 [Lachnospiraceae bacterium]|nr:hypothetical protein [Lachnospiraceae bacterium]